MDNIEDDYFTNLSWLNSSELSSTVHCANNHIDDDLQCLCWLIKIRPISSLSHSLKRLSTTTNKVHPLNTDDSPPSRRVLMVRTLNNPLSPTSSSQQSFIFIRSSNGKISCLSIRHFV